MVRLSGVYLRAENGVGLDDISGEVVAWARPNPAAGVWAVEIHFRLRRARPRFVGQRYDIEIPLAAAELRRRASVEDGYQLAGTLHVTRGKIVIDDPVSRPKPTRRVEFVPTANGSEAERAVP